MNKIFNFKVKSNNGRNVALFVSLIFVSISGILTTKMYRNKISKVESYDNKFANVKVASGSQVITINKNEDNSNINSGKNILYANKNIVRLKTEDTARPDNIDTIETKKEKSLVKWYDKLVDKLLWAIIISIAILALKWIGAPIDVIQNFGG